MNPEHSKLVEKECFELIEKLDSQWSCQACYVNKRSEQVRNKLRLVINYQPLNQILMDDKFSIPNRLSLFSQIATAKWFLKIDLKARFW